MELPTLTPVVGDCVLDTDFTLMALSTFDHFKGGKEQLIEPVDLLALFAFAEATVLHERVLSEWIDKEDLTRSDTIPQLVKSGALGRIDHVTDYDQNKPDEFQRNIWSQLERLAEGLGHWTGADFTLSASITRARWCDAKNVDHLPWPVFGALPGEGIRRRHVIDQGYAHVSTLLKERVIELRGAGAPIPLYIPPIPAIVLQRCGDRADRFFAETLALREEFADARRKLRSYQTLISNEDGKTLGELSQAYRDAVSDVTAALDRVAAKRTDSSVLMELWDTVCEVKASRSDRDATLETGLNLSALLTKGFKWLEVRRVRARARLLFDLYQKSLQIKNYGSLIGRVFKTNSAKLMRTADSLEVIGSKIDRIVSVNRLGTWPPSDTDSGLTRAAPEGPL